MKSRVIYEGPAEGLLERLGDLGQRKVQLIELEPVNAPRSFDAEALEQALNQIREIMKDAPVLPDKIFTAEDYYLPDRFGPNA